MKLSNNIFKIKGNKYVDLLPNLKEEKPRKISSIVLSLIAFSFFGIFAINPTLSTIAKLRKELSDSQFVDKKLEEKLFNLSSLQVKYTSIENDIPIILTAIPPDPQIPVLIAQVQALSKKHNISLASAQSLEVEAANQEAKKDYYSFSFAAGGEGTYENIMSFLSSLSGMQRVITIETLSLSKKSGSENLDFNVKARAYFKDQ